ncbi:HipA family kinase [Paenibacillus sp. GCM10027628]|uniref:HipA family kinase n=1 Tax=Paenibacillus sp. GCM10027628 TaxID=3273413 RepID=UPI0036329228
MGKLKPVSYIRSMSRGKSSPHLIEFSDHHNYVVKFKNNPQGNWVLINEYIVNNLASLLELPIPRYKVVRISKQFIEENENLHQKNFKSGKQFASRYTKHSLHVTDLKGRPVKDQINNLNQVGGLLVFDHWVSNSDRNLKNLLLRPVGHQYYFEMIDHANCFNITPNNPEREFLPLQVRKGKLYRWFNSLIDHKKQLTSYVEKISEIKNEDIHTIIHSLPGDWKVSDKEKEKLYSHIKYAKKALPGIIDDYWKANFE